MQPRPYLSLIAGLAGLLWATALPAQTAEFVSRLTWQVEDARFGGFSALELSDDGGDFVALSDRGRIVTGTLTRQDGRLTGTTIRDWALVRTPGGDPVTELDQDSEGLAIRADGRIFISFEGHHRVWGYDQIGGSAAPLTKHYRFPGLPGNGSFEALAVDDAGMLLSLPETPGPPGLPLPVFINRYGVWEQPFDLPQRGNFRPVGADFGPDGWLYLLERDFNGIFGFASQVRRFDLSAFPFREEVVLQTITGDYDNLEGLAVWRDAAGRICLTMISDDNFRSFQRTEIVEFRIPTGLAQKAEGE